MTNIPPTSAPTIRPPRRSRRSTAIRVLFWLLGVLIFICCGIPFLVSALLFVIRYHYPEDDELITMFHNQRAELEQLRTMMQYDNAPKFSKADFVGYEFQKREFTGKFTAHTLLDTLKAHGVLHLPKTTYLGKPIRPTALKSLNYILEDSTNLHLTFNGIPLPKEAEDLLRRGSPLNRIERVELNRLILQTVFPDKCPKKYSPQEAPNKLLEVIAARDIPVPEALTAMESLNRLLNAPSLQDKFKDIPLPKDAEPLAAQASSLNEGERIRLNRLILQAAFPQECPEARGPKLWAIYDRWALTLWLGMASSHRPNKVDLISLGVTEERFKQYQRLLRSVRYKGAWVESASGEIEITVYIVGLSIGGATFKGYVHRRSPPDPKEIVPSLDFQKPKSRSTLKPPRRYRHLEGNWYLYRMDD